VQSPGPRTGGRARSAYKGSVSAASPFRRLITVLTWAALLLGPLLGPTQGQVFAEEPTEPTEPTEPDALVTTTWAVRQAAAELLTELRRQRGADAHALFEQVRALAAENGDALIAVDGVYAPLAEVLAAALNTTQHAKAYAELYAAPAEAARQTLLSEGASSEAWRRLARTYPGTPAAESAWRRLADRAWDLGHIGTYLAVAAQAGEGQEPATVRRLQAAQSLLGKQTVTRLPRMLDLQEMWRLDLPAAEVIAGGGRRGMAMPAIRPTFVMSATSEDLTAASDGISCFLFDHLVGRRVGELHALGRSPLPGSTCRPATWRGGFVAAGQDQGGQVLLTAIGRNGQQLWRAPTPGAATLGAVSAPVVVDDVVAIAMLGGNEDGPELRVVALRLADGSVAWNRFIAKLPALMGRARFLGDGTVTPPLLIHHAGGLLLLPSTGLLARLDSLGSVQRIWTYPVAGLALEDRFSGRREAPRPAGLASDGAWAVATPADAGGFVWVLGPKDDSPRRYQDDGARGSVVAVSAGMALLSGKQTTFLQCADLTPRWHRNAGAANPSGSIGTTTVLIAGDERLTLLRQDTGEVISERSAEPPLTFAAIDGMVVVAGPEALVAYGDAAAFIAEQQDAIAKDPSDYRPYVAIGKVWAAQGRTSEAYDQLLRGLERGAPADYAAVAARLLRHQVEQALGDSKAFATAMTRFERLVPYSRDLAGETAYWQARHAEQTGKKTEAERQYQLVLQGQHIPIELGQGRDQQLEASLHAMAQAGLARLLGGQPPTWAMPVPPAAATTANVKAWTQDTSRSRAVLVAGQQIYCYEGGRLTARRIEDGSESWTRLPDLRLLGVRMTGAVDPDTVGVPVDVLEGTAAAAAGVRKSDVITAFNDRPIADFHRDLIPAVTESADGAAFTLVVQRGTELVKLSGRLGGELVEAFAADHSTCLVWPVMPLPGRRNQGEGLWVSALDAQTGREILRWSLPPVTMERLPPRPLLTADRAMITLDGVDLVAVELGGKEPGAVRWRLPGQGMWLDQLSVLGQGALLISDPTHGLFRILDLTSGEIIFSVSGDAGMRPLLHGTDLFLRTPAGTLACWDLGAGRLRWRNDIAIHTLVAARGDAVFVLDDRKRLHVLDRANGTNRRQYGDWALIDQAISHGEGLTINGRRSDGDRMVAAISLPAGAPLWERTLPRGTEIREFHASAQGALVVLAEPNQRPSVLALGTDGAITAARYLGDQDVVQPAGNGFLIHSALALTGVPAGLDLPMSPVLPVPQITAGPSLLATVQAVLPTVEWQTVGDGSYAVLGSGRSRIILARLPLGVETMHFRLASGSAPIDITNQLLVVQRQRVARFNDLDEGWRLNASQRIPTADKTYLLAVQLDPPLGQAPGIAIQIRASAGETIDGPEVPWWLRRSWRPLVDVAVAPVVPPIPGAVPAPTGVGNPLPTPPRAP